MVYGIVSDIHFHNWTAFSQIDPGTGMNSRMTLLLDELRRTADSVMALGGRELFIAGDVFHVRGQIAPSVLNPVRRLLEDLTHEGEMTVYILAGNHDLESRSSNWLGSAVSSLSSDYIITVSAAEFVVTLDSGRRVGMIPWQDNLDTLKAKIEGMQGKAQDLIIHAPMNDVIKGIPDTGLDPNWLASLSFENIFSGHYHNHKCFHDKVYSIGALAHHTWSDVGTRAGHLMVNDGKVTYHASHCPEFVEIDSSMSENDMALAADGNYVRARLATSNLAEVQAVREALIEAGARGVNVIAEPNRTAVSRAATSVKKGMTIEESVAQFIDPTGTDADRAVVRAVCLDILNEAQSV